MASYENQNSPPKTPGRSFSEEELLIYLHDPLGLENLESPPKNLLGFQNPESPPEEDTVSATPPRIITEVVAGSTSMDRGMSPITWVPSSPTQPSLEWKLIHLELPEPSRPVYKDFLPKPDKYSSYLLSADPRFESEM